MSLHLIKRNHNSIWNCWIQKFKPQNIESKKKKVLEYVIDEILIKVGSLEFVWIWIVIELESKEFVGITISKERKCVYRAERYSYLKIIVEYGKQPIFSSEDGGGTGYPSKACRLLNLKHYFNFIFEKSIIIERIMQYIKDRT